MNNSLYLPGLYLSNDYELTITCHYLLPLHFFSFLSFITIIFSLSSAQDVFLNNKTLTNCEDFPAFVEEHNANFLVSLSPLQLLRVNSKMVLIPRHKAIIFWDDDMLATKLSHLPHPTSQSVSTTGYQVLTCTVVHTVRACI